jgi:hypothetical protein
MLPELDIEGVLRPGTALMCRALTSSSANRSSSRFHSGFQ